MYKPKVLIVEDDPAISNLIRTTLDTQNYQYHTAQTGSGAILDAVSYNPDVIILDLGLPDMDGVDTVSYTHLSPAAEYPKDFERRRLRWRESGPWGISRASGGRIRKEKDTYNQGIRFYNGFLIHK